MYLRRQLRLASRTNVLIINATVYAFQLFRNVEGPQKLVKNWSAPRSTVYTGIAAQQFVTLVEGLEDLQDTGIP